METRNAYRTSEDLDALADRFRDTDPERVLRWAFEKYGSRLVLATGFSPSGVVLLHLAHKLSPSTPVGYVETDLLLPETYALRDELKRRLGIQFIEIRSRLSLLQQETEYGAELWISNPERCCYLRKFRPLELFLSQYEAWVTGTCRDQASNCTSPNVVGWDATYGLVRINPLINMTSDEVWDYIERNGLPFNPLHRRGYPTIECIPCTIAAASGGAGCSGFDGGSGAMYVPRELRR